MHETAPRPAITTGVIDRKFYCRQHHFQLISFWDEDGAYTDIIVSVIRQWHHNTGLAASHFFPTIIPVNTTTWKIFIVICFSALFLSSIFIITAIYNMATQPYFALRAHFTRSYSLVPATSALCATDNSHTLSTISLVSQHAYVISFYFRCVPWSLYQYFFDISSNYHWSLPSTI